MSDKPLVVVEKIKKVYIKSPFKGKHFFLPEVDSGVITVKFTNSYPDINSGYERFRMNLHSKKNLRKYMEDICDDGNRLLNHTAVKVDNNTDEGSVKITKLNTNGEVANEFIMRYLAVKIDIDDNSHLMRAELPVFIADLINIITDDFIILCKSYINQEYVGSMDEAIDESYKAASTWYDADIKRLCEVKYIGNILIPLATHYCNSTPVLRQLDTKEFMFEVYKAVFERVCAGTDTNTYQKLYRYTENLTRQGYKSNRMIYNTLRINAVTVDSLINDIFIKILVIIIPKLDPMDTVPALLAETIKKSAAHYGPRVDNGYSRLDSFSDGNYVSGGGGEDNIITEAERLEARVKKSDGLLNLVRKISCDDTINKIAASLNMYETGEVYHFTYQSLLEDGGMHEFQKRVIFDIFIDYYGGYDNMYDNNHHNYTRLLTLADQVLRRAGCNILADCVIGKMRGISYNNRWGTKTSDKKLFEDPRYSTIINGKYRYIRARIERKNFIKEMCQTIMASSFYYNQIGNPNNGEPIVYDDETVINEVLNYFTNVIR